MLDATTLSAINGLFESETAIKLASLLEKMGVSLEILNGLAIEGMKAKGIEVGPKHEDFDPILNHQDAADYLGCGWKHVREKLIPEYGMEVIDADKKTKKFELSELNRVKQLMKARKNGKPIQVGKPLDS